MIVYIINDAYINNSTSHAPWEKKKLKQSYLKLNNSCKHFIRDALMYCN